MSTGAKVRSIEALEAFRSTLLLYLARGSAALDDVTQDIVRVRIWLETDRRVHWQREIRRRRALAAQAEQELTTARLWGDPAAITDRKRALARARETLREAEEALERVRRWLQRYPTEIEARGALPRRLQHVFATETSRAVSFLENAAAILSDYAGREVAPAAAAAPDRGPTGAPLPGVPAATDAAGPPNAEEGS